MTRGWGKQGTTAEQITRRERVLYRVNFLPVRVSRLPGVLTLELWNTPDGLLLRSYPCERIPAKLQSWLEATIW